MTQALSCAHDSCDPGRLCVFAEAIVKGYTICSSCILSIENREILTFCRVRELQHNDNEKSFSVSLVECSIENSPRVRQGTGSPTVLGVGAVADVGTQLRGGSDELDWGRTRSFALTGLGGGVIWAWWSRRE